MNLSSEAVGDNSQGLTPTAWQEVKEEHSTPIKKKEKGLGRSGVLECIPVEEDSIDIGEPLDSLDQSMITVTGND